ncbi:uncharacterized protein EDB93DRAFT_549811 [Suillus bovinus]|uniref:uncharacterized protein n=1 Tax=Suillus bovinus TaxID=48563 RepID=UPI001B86F725|nr:uncharacterized protein EDB93DRAFT_549811 [Suillus bovinus]KAG2144180.1 hypothetical protein EDB93DRAFT_549811 [Suillus bovinus]
MTGKCTSDPSETKNSCIPTVESGYNGTGERASAYNIIISCQPCLPAEPASNKYIYYETVAATRQREIEISNGHAWLMGFRSHIVHREFCRFRTATAWQTQPVFLRTVELLVTPETQAQVQVAQLGHRYTNDHQDPPQFYHLSVVLPDKDTMSPHLIPILSRILVDPYMDLSARPSPSCISIPNNPGCVRHPHGPQTMPQVPDSAVPYCKNV